MKLGILFRSAVETGMRADPRGPDGIARFLRMRKKRSTAAKQTGHHARGDADWNPYADCAVLHGGEDVNVRTLLVGIDTETPELLLADTLRTQGMKVDAVLGHHPEGRALLELSEVMDVQVDILRELGIPEQKAEMMLRKRTKQLYGQLHAQNALRTERAAQLLDIPFLCVHNAADHCAAKYIYDRVLHAKYDTVGDIVEALYAVPEYDHYARQGVPPLIVAGRSDARAGKTAVFGFNGGTGGPAAFMRELATAGVGTILCMHASAEQCEIADKHHLSVIQCCHMASDTLGMNLVLDALQKEDSKLKIVPFSGFVRIER